MVHIKSKKNKVLIILCFILIVLVTIYLEVNKCELVKKIYNGKLKKRNTYPSQELMLP